MVAPDTRQGLLLTNDIVLDVQTVHAAMDHHNMPRTSSVATASSSTSLTNLPKAAFDTVVSLSSAPGHHDVPFLGLLLATLRAGGKLTVEERLVCGLWATSSARLFVVLPELVHLCKGHPDRRFLCRAKARWASRRASCSAGSHR